MADWLPDPLARHQERFHDGVRWTERVRDRGVENTDGSGLDTLQPPEPSVPVVTATPYVPSTATAPPGPPPPRGGRGAGPAPQFGKIGSPQPEPVPMVPAITSSSSPLGGPGPAGGPPMGPPLGPPPGMAPAGQGAALAALGKNSVLTGLIAGAIGGALGAMIAEALYSPDNHSATTESGLRMSSGIFVMFVGAAIGFVIAAWPGFTSGAWAKGWRDGAIGSLAGAAAGFAGGYVAQILFTNMLKDVSIYADRSEVENKLRLARGLAWAIFGAAAGLGLGMREGSKKAMTGLFGGALGGAIGGLIFEQFELSQSTDAGFQTRLIGLTATGIGIGLGIGVVERLARSAWLNLQSGPLAGREVILFKDATTIGADSRCDLVLANDPIISLHHATIERRGGTTSVVPVGPVAVNGTAIGTPHPLRAGDSVQIGATAIRYEERAIR
jgi:hypothetical protein